MRYLIIGEFSETPKAPSLGLEPKLPAMPAARPVELSRAEMAGWLDRPKRAGEKSSPAPLILGIYTATNVSLSDGIGYITPRPLPKTPGIFHGTVKSWDGKAVYLGAGRSIQASTALALLVTIQTGPNSPPDLRHLTG